MEDAELVVFPSLDPGPVVPASELVKGVYAVDVMNVVFVEIVECWNQDFQLVEYLGR